MLLCRLSLNKRKKSITINLNTKKDKLVSGFSKSKAELLKHTGKLFPISTHKKKDHLRKQTLKLESIKTYFFAREVSKILSPPPPQ